MVRTNKTNMKTETICDECKSLCISPDGMDRGTIWYSHFCLVSPTNGEYKKMIDKAEEEHRKEYIPPKHNFLTIGPCVKGPGWREKLSRNYQNCRDIRTNDKECEKHSPLKEKRPKPTLLERLAMKIDFSTHSEKQYRYWANKCEEALKLR